MRAEGSLEGTCVAHAERYGFLSWKMRIIGRRGGPDRFFQKPGRPVWVEFKDPEGTLSLQQKRRIRELRAAGAEVHVVSSFEEFCRVMGLPDG